jgi:hypothetical protein
MSPPRPRRYWLIALVVFGALGLSCTNPFLPVTKDVGLYSPALSPEAVIENMKSSYSVMNLEEYIACLDPDSFRFFFYEQEGDSLSSILENEWGIDSLVWGLTEERKSAEAIFDACEDIYLELAKISGHNNGQTGVYYYEYHLSLTPPPLIEETIRGRARFTLKKDPYTGHWAVTTWEDFSY